MPSALTSRPLGWLQSCSGSEIGTLLVSGATAIKQMTLYCQSAGALPLASSRSHLIRRRFEFCTKRSVTDEPKFRMCASKAVPCRQSALIADNQNIVSRTRNRRNAICLHDLGAQCCRVVGQCNRQLWNRVVRSSTVVQRHAPGLRPNGFRLTGYEGGWSEQDRWSTLVPYETMWKQTAETSW